MGRLFQFGSKHTEEFKKLQSERAIARGLGGHTSKNMIHYKKRDGSDVFLQSSYEIRFATLLDKLKIDWDRPSPLWYIDEIGKKHRYYPDFKIGKIYLDTKNDYLAIKDLPKIAAVREQNEVDLRIVVENQINEDFIKALQT